MTSKTLPRSTARVGASFAATILVCLLAPAAGAQVGTTSPTDAVANSTEQTGDIVTDTGGQVGDTVGEVGDTVGEVGDTVGDTGGQVGDTVGDTGGQVGDTVGDTGGQVGDTIGGPGGDIVGDASEDVGNTVKDTTGKVGDTIADTGGEVEDTVGEVGGDTGGAVGRLGGATDGTADDLVGGNVPGVGNAGEGPRFGAVSPGFAKNFFSDATGIGSQRAPSLGGPFGAADALDLSGTELVGSASDVAAPVGFEEFVQEALEAARQFAFPLVLTLLVGAYLMLQSRVDKRDPKLAMASVDPEEDLLSFS
jgi:hypothetical protein